MLWENVCNLNLVGNFETITFHIHEKFQKLYLSHHLKAEQTKLKLL